MSGDGGQPREKFTPGGLASLYDLVTESLDESDPTMYTEDRLYAAMVRLSDTLARKLAAATHIRQARQ